MGSSASELSAELLDDFYAECDEHLTNLRTRLASLTGVAEAQRQDAAAWQSIARSFHSFKGNSAIVGLVSAETLSHAAESLVARIVRHTVDPRDPEMDLLARVTHRLEQIISAHRLKSGGPETADLLAQLAPYHSAAGAPAAAPTLAPAAPAEAPAPDAPTHSGPAWIARFSPSAELDARGINVNTVRARLGKLGTILRGVPSIAEGGKMVFEFRVAVSEPPADLAAWAHDGIRLTEEPPAGPNESEAAPAGLFTAPSQIVRVDLGRLDDVMRITGDLIIHRFRLDEGLARISGDDAGLREVGRGLGRSLKELREAISRLRLVPMTEIFSRLPFIIRDLERESGKSVRLTVEGGETEIDKYLVERLKEPLLHLVRNAVSHGIETPRERTAGGKPAAASLSIRASVRADGVVIAIRDDGRGIDANKVAERAAQQGLPVPEPLDEPALLRLICTPGFSTKDEADRASGRGVGMAVVASTVRELGGRLELATEAGRSTEFTLWLPLTLSIARTLIVSAGGHTCAVPQGFVEEVIQIDTAELRRIRQVDLAPYRSGVLPLVWLRSALGVTPSAETTASVLVIGTERGTAGLVVDRIHAQREVVVRPLQDELVRVPGVSGATELGDGRPVLILDAVELTRGAARPRQAGSTASSS